MKTMNSNKRKYKFNKNKTKKKHNKHERNVFNKNIKKKN